MCYRTCDCEEIETPTTPRIGWAKTADVGSCNFCTLPRTKVVLVIQSPTGLQVRMCARCHEMIRKVTR